MTQPSVLKRVQIAISRWAESLFTNPKLVHLIGREPVRLRYVGRKSGRTFELPVWARRRPEGLNVQVAQPAKKTWWRNFRKQSPISVRLDGTWREGLGQVVEPKPGRVEVEIGWL